MKRQSTKESSGFNALHVLVVGSGCIDFSLISENATTSSWYIPTPAPTLEAAAESLKGNCFDAIACHISAYNGDGLAIPSLVLELFHQGKLTNIPALLWCCQAASNIMDTHAHLAQQLGVPVKIVPSLNTCVAHDFARLVREKRVCLPPISSHNDLTPNDRDLEQALLADHNIRVVLQPQINLISGRIVGAEALARWSHSKLGDIPPSVFVPLANETGLDGLLFHCIQTKVIKILQHLKSLQIAVPISVNASAETLCSAKLTSHLEKSLSAAGVHNSLFKIELTEDTPATDILSLSTAISWLRLRNFSVSIDDFGCGAATLDLFTKLPFSELKIDGNFVRNMNHNQSCEAAVATSILLARNLNLNVIAEGVESTEISEFLLAQGCFIGQGYGLSPPLEENDFFIALLKNTSEYAQPLQASQMTYPSSNI
ncbi:EAL domain-containing protein [Pseudomonas aeruginosa]